MPAIAVDPETIPGLLAAQVAVQPEAVALGGIVDGQLRWQTWAELRAAVIEWAAAMRSLGAGRGDRIVQVSSNRREWILADLAMHQIGAVHVPLHAALGAAQVAELTQHCGAVAAVVENRELAEQLRRAMPNLPCQLIDDMPTVATDSSDLPEPSVAPDDLATILYTSGTTGPPRGVMLSQRNLAANALAMATAAGPSAIDVETRLGLLPLSHIYARTCDLYCWLVRGSRLALAESRETIMRDLRLVAPTAINAVPYFYQKVADQLLLTAGESVSGDALRATLGGAIRRCFCGGAALSPQVDEFFAKRDLPILCGYGLTEAGPVITATAPGDYQSGTVGRPAPGVDVRLADDGEVLARGPSIMSGYWRNEPESDEALRDGWLHTGDLGEWTPAGHLRIVGRKKEMIVLATGKKVAPTQIEKLLAGSPWIEQVCVVGDGRKCLTALIVPNGEALRQEIKRRRLWVWSKRRAVTHPQIRALYRAEIDRCLAEQAAFEQIAAFTLLDRALSQETGEVTPKLSLCRAVIERTLAPQIEAMYAMAARR
jgi:long-chain acyl-CoA synthetase